MKSVILNILFAGIVWADATFYVDSDWKGTRSGTQNQPWSSLNWSAINSALEGGNVIVYFSARAADGGKTDDKYDSSGGSGRSTISLDNRTDMGGNRLTLDGNSFYNADDGNPSWRPNEWRSFADPMCQINSATAQNDEHRKINNITLHGFRILCSSSDKLISIAGDNCIVEYNDASHTGTGGSGPGVMLTPTANSAHEGSSAWAPPSNNVTFRYNRIHDTQGEAMYIGGAGLDEVESGSGYPSHTDVTILENEIYQAGKYGGQGDGIDIKAGMSNVVVRGNIIHNCDGEVRGIVAQGNQQEAGGLVIDSNKIYDMTLEDAAIVLSDSWGTPKETVISNNIIYNNRGGGGIRIYDSHDEVLVANNTIWDNDGPGISNADGAIKLRNNWVFGNAGNEVDLRGAINSNYNAYADGSWGYNGEGSNSIVTTSNSLANPGNADFSIPPGSPIIGKGRDLPEFEKDFNGNARTEPWDIGAIKFASTTAPTPSPTPPAPTPTPLPTPAPTPTSTPAPIAPLHTHRWEDITGKPAKFPPAEHDHP